MYIYIDYICHFCVIKLVVGKLISWFFLFISGHIFTLALSQYRSFLKISGFFSQ